MSNLRTAADTLNRAAPPGERLAYVNPNEEGMLRAIGGTGQESSGGVPSYKKGDVEAPPARDYGQETYDTLMAQIKLAPQLFASEASSAYGRPAYARMEQNMLWDSLVGEGQGAYGGGYAAGPTGAMGAAGMAGAPAAEGSRKSRKTSTEAPPSRQRGGLLELYEEHIAPSIMRQQRTAAEGEIGMLRELGPEFMEAMRSADPESEKIRQRLQRQAMSGLEVDEGENVLGMLLEQRAREGMEAGQGLTREELAGITESVRSGQAARGSAYQRSQPAMIEETMERMGAGRRAEAERIQRAQQIFGQGQAARQASALREAQRVQQAQSILGQTGAVDPFLALTGRSARVPSQVGQQLGTAGFALQAGPQLFNPESQYAGALAGSNQANIMNARMATQANRAAIAGSLIESIGAVGSVYAGKP